MVVLLNCNWAGTAGGLSTGAVVAAAADVVAAADGVGSAVESVSLLEPHAVATMAVAARTAIMVRFKTVPLKMGGLLCATAKNVGRLARSISTLWSGHREYAPSPDLITQPIVSSLTLNSRM